MIVGMRVASTRTNRQRVKRCRCSLCIVHFDLPALIWPPVRLFISCATDAIAAANCRLALRPILRGPSLVAYRVAIIACIAKHTVSLTMGPRVCICAGAELSFYAQLGAHSSASHPAESMSVKWCLIV